MSLLSYGSESDEFFGDADASQHPAVEGLVCIEGGSGWSSSSVSEPDPSDLDTPLLLHCCWDDESEEAA